MMIKLFLEGWVSLGLHNLALPRDGLTVRSSRWQEKGGCLGFTCSTHVQNSADMVSFYWAKLLLSPLAPFLIEMY